MQLGRAVHTHSLSPNPHLASQYDEEEERGGQLAGMIASQKERLRQEQDDQMFPDEVRPRCLDVGREPSAAFRRACRTHCCSVDLPACMAHPPAAWCLTLLSCSCY